MIHAQNGCLQLTTGKLDYVRFGAGKGTLVLIPGAGDGLRTVKGLAVPFALLYRDLAKDFTVFVFSRRRELPQHVSTREMARDLAESMDMLQLSQAAVVGISQGGMIAQWLAVDFPEKLSRLVLAVTAGRPNDTLLDVTGLWMEMARNGDYRRIMLDTAERSYSPKRLWQARLSCRLMGNWGKPKSFDRFLTQIESCAGHDAYDRLPEIACPTLVVGGVADRIVTAEASRELAARIPDSRLWLLEGLGHGLYEEEPSFFRQVAEFCRG